MVDISLPTAIRPLCRSSELFGPDDAGRDEVEAFIRASYWRHYRATLSALPPYLLVLRDGLGEIVAACGLRPTTTGSRLFLEAYLDEPVEAAVGRLLHRCVQRRDVVEVGSLAVRHPGAARVLIQAMTAFLCQQGFRWVVFTAVPALRNAFHRLGLRPAEICPADPARLGSESAAWGSYYDGGPLVMCGDIGEGYRRLQKARIEPMVPTGFCGPRAQGLAE